MISIPQGSGPGQGSSLSDAEDDGSYNRPLDALPDADTSLDQNYQATAEHKKSTAAIIRVAAIGFVGLILLVSSVVFYMRQGSHTALQTSNFDELQLPLKDLAISDDLVNAQSLKVHGRLEVDSSIALSPSVQPKNPVSGQLYFDQERNHMSYYDGSQFIPLQGNAGTIITNISNISNGDSIATQVTNVFNSNNQSLNGAAGRLAMFTGSGTVSESLVQQSGTNVQVASSGITTVSVGSSSGASSAVMQGGTGGAAMSTGASDGVTGSISITTGNSSTTASGNIFIDSGSGIIDGEVVENKTFESGIEDMQDWFNTTLATTTAQAHSGSQSLQVTPSSPFWGVIELFPGTAVTPGHQYHFSIWIRASTTPRTINASISWTGSGSTTAFAATVDSTTGWTEMSLTAPAPAGATAASFRIQTNTGAAGEVHYIDDMVITDLSSGSAISALEFGSTNAKIITIGNLNQIGATTIRGGSGVNIQSGAASTVINGGSLSMTGNAASTLNTTNGALTITSAATATWGIGTATAGVGGDLTLRAGQGGSDGNNDGGDLILQGGARNGSGNPGSVIIKPSADTTDALQIQNSAGTSFLLANSTTMTIAVTGTAATFATLSLDNAHFRSTQTTPPTIGIPASCGTTPTAAVSAGSTDTAGSFSITTGTGGTASSCDVMLTFNKPYGAAPKSILIAGKTTAASANRQIFVSASDATTFTTSFGVSAGGADSTTYSFNYWVIE